MYRLDVGFVRCNGLVGSGADYYTKVVIGTSAKLTGYGLIFLFSLLVYVLEVFVGWVSADGSQGWALEIYL